MVQYTYDTYGRLLTETYEDGAVVSYAYDNTGALASVTDSATGQTRKYYYDFLDRPVKYTEEGGTGLNSHAVLYTYDKINNLAQRQETINNETWSTSYAYDKDNRLKAFVSLKEENGYYSVDWEAFENALKRKPPIFILCNPHNPVGRCWTKEELKRMGDLCIRYGTLIVSDEIHSDLMLFGNKHIPMPTVSQEIAANTITCTSATKTFNLAGLQAATIVFPNDELIEKYQKFWKSMDVHRNNSFSTVAVIAAFREGEEWLEQLLKHLESNVEYVEKFLQENIPEIKLHRPECTYLLWLNCKDLGLKGDALPKFIIEKAKLALNDGRGFGAEGEGFMRMNIACNRQTVEKAMQQLKIAVDGLMGR